MPPPRQAAGAHNTLGKIPTFTVVKRSFGKEKEESSLSKAMLQKIRQRQVVSWATIETLCRLLECDVGDIVEYSAETAEPTEESLTDN